MNEDAQEKQLWLATLAAVIAGGLVASKPTPQPPEDIAAKAYAIADELVKIADARMAGKQGA